MNIFLKFSFYKVATEKEGKFDTIYATLKEVGTELLKLYLRFLLAYVKGENTGCPTTGIQGVVSLVKLTEYHVT